MGLGVRNLTSGTAVVSVNALVMMLSTQWSYITTKPSKFYGWSGCIKFKVEGWSVNYLREKLFSWTSKLIGLEQMF